MSRTTISYWVLLALFVAATLAHVLFLGGSLGNLAQQDEYTYDQTVNITGALGEIRLSMFIPADASGLAIRDETFEAADLDLEIQRSGGDRLLVLQGRPASAGRQIRYWAQIQTTTVEYHLDRALPWRPADPDDTPYLVPTPTVQADAGEIADLLGTIFGFDDDAAQQRKQWDATQWMEALARSGVGPVMAMTRIFAHCNTGIRVATFSGTTDALTALRLGESSCGGKSRLMVALCRRLGLPARIVGGVILGQPGRKRAHHLWVQVRLGGVWVPFDPLNDYLAIHPARFLTLYHGDQALIRHSRGLTFDYGFSSVRHSIPLIWLGEPHAPNAGTVGPKARVIPLLARENFSAILLAPFALLLIVFARQVVGVESIGIFLPILLGFSLIQADWIVTGIQMALAILLGVLMRFLLTRLNLLHVPRTAVMITFVVLFFLAFSAGLGRFDSFGGVGTVVLPLAALAMAVEKFTIVAMDRGTRAALGLLLQTILLAVGCRAILVTPFFQNLTIAFPEVLVLIIAMIILIGNYRGLRWREYWRFRHVRRKGAA